jgi:hypothetical protein
MGWQAVPVPPSSTAGSSVCELENFDFIGVSHNGVHCDSPCSTIVSSLVVVLASLSSESYESNG